MGSMRPPAASSWSRRRKHITAQCSSLLPPPRPRFAAEIFAARGRTSQALQYLELIAGFKPLLDDWIALDRYRDYVRACARYGLKVRRGPTFLMVEKNRVPESVLGREFITTTSAYGLPADARGAGRGQVHVYVSRDAALLRRGMWYPLIVRGRVIMPAYADSLRYGETLGYPECCIRFFRARNNWRDYSFLFEIFKNTSGQPSLLCNPLMKDVWLAYSYHMPCSFRCEASLRGARRLRAELRRRDPETAELADRLLAGPHLVLYEREAWKFSGRLSGGTLRYDRFQRLGPAAPALDRALARGDSLRIAGRDLLIGRGAAPAARVRVPLTPVEPKLMFLADFHDD